MKETKTNLLPRNRGIASVALRSIHVAGETLTDRREQDEVFATIKQITENTGWNVRFMFEELPQKWGWNSNSNSNSSNHSHSHSHSLNSSATSSPQQGHSVQVPVPQIHHQHTHSQSGSVGSGEHLHGSGYGAAGATLGEPQSTPGVDGVNMGMMTDPDETFYMQVFVEEVGCWMDSMDPQKHVSILASCEKWEEEGRGFEYGYNVWDSSLTLLITVLPSPPFPRPHESHAP